MPETSLRTGSAYLFVDDAAQLAQEWSTAGVQVHQPEDTEWGMHEGAVEDPDGNVIRSGSPTESDEGTSHNALPGTGRQRIFSGADRHFSLFYRPSHNRRPPAQRAKHL